MPKRELLFPPELISEARRLHLRGATQFEIGKVLGCSQQTAGRRIRDWGWGPSRLRGLRPEKEIRPLRLQRAAEIVDEPEVDEGAAAPV